MEFLNHVQPLLCHDPQYVKVVTAADSQPGLQCQYCLQMLPVYAYVDQVAERDANEACRLAEMYYEWTGDHKIPVRFPLIGIDGLLPKVIENQTLGRISTSVRLLKWLNAPFTQNAEVTSIDTIKVHLNDLLKNCIEKMKESQKNESRESENASSFNVMNSLVEMFESRVTDTNCIGFELYINTYVPFVKSCKNDDTLWLPPDTACTKPLIGQLKEQLLRSQAIRKLYSMYCYPFDIFHVIAGSYSCCSDIDVLQNWLLDFVIRVCRGQFFWKQFESNLQIQHLLNVLKKEVTFKRHNDLHYLVKQIRDGEGIECMSENLFKYGQLEQLLSEKNSETLMRFQFPNVLFDNHYDQLAFTISLIVLQMSVNRRTGQVLKGTYSKVRHLSNLVKNVIRQLHEFDQRVNLPWTDSTFQLFLASNKQLGEQLKEVMKIINPFKKKEDEENGIDMIL